MRSHRLPRSLTVRAVMAVRKEFPLEELEALYAESPRDAIGAVCDELSAEDGSTLARQLLTALSHERDESRLHVLVLQASLMSDYGQAWPGTDGDITLDPQLIDVLLQRRQRHNFIIPQAYGPI